MMVSGLAEEAHQAHNIALVALPESGNSWAQPANRLSIMSKVAAVDP
jgi:hypothetical protein